MADTDKDLQQDWDEWAREELERHNAMGDAARRRGYVVKMMGDDERAPELNPDGSQKDEVGDHEALDVGAIDVGGEE